MSVSSSDEKQFAIFSSSSVQACADAIGINSLSDEILKKLSEDATYRVREIVSKSCEFMRYSKRKNLKSVDVNRALRWSNVQPVNGANEALKFNCVEGVFYPTDSLIDLKEIGLSELKPLQRHQIVMHTEWLDNEHLHNTSSHEKKESEENAEDEVAEKDYNCFDAYYTSLVECILSDNKVILTRMLNDLKCNPRAGRLVSYLTTFVSGAKLMSHDLCKLSQMLYVVKALLNNKYISIQLYLTPLLKAVLYCVLEPLAASINPFNDHWVVRDYGALLAAQLVYSHASEADFHRSFVHTSIHDIISDTTKPLCSHYGAVILAGMLGEDSIKTFILPGLCKYIKSFLHPIIEDTSHSNVHMKMDAQKVLGACMFCVEKIHYKVDFVKQNLTLRYPDLDPMFTELFGDSFVIRLPLHQFEKASKETGFERKSTTTIPWHCYSLCSKIGRGLLLKQQKKVSLNDFFDPVYPVKRHKPIHINFGVSRPVKNKNCYLHSVIKEELVSLPPHQLQLVRRIVPSQRKFVSSNIYSCL